jgi:LmbE family N-acetylglucosaminyl deacetylase
MISLQVRTRREDGSIALDTSLARVLTPGPWLVVSPHDDDVILGMGMTVAAAIREGIEVHVAVATDGSLGYMQPHEQPSLVATRKRELAEAGVILGLPPAHVHSFDFPDGSLIAHQGCRPAGASPTLGQRLVALLRTVRPAAVFACTPRDIHPDHRVVASETDMACCWATSRIWLELGEPIADPARFEYAVYCPFSGAPDLEISAPVDCLEQKLRSLFAFRSQGVIDPMIARLRADGPFEYLRRHDQSPYRPGLYRGLFRE